MWIFSHACGYYHLIYWTIFYFNLKLPLKYILNVLLFLFCLPSLSVCNFLLSTHIYLLFLIIQFTLWKLFLIVWNTFWTNFRFYFVCRRLVFVISCCLFSYIFFCYFFWYSKLFLLVCLPFSSFSTVRALLLFVNSSFLCFCSCYITSPFPYRNLT